MERRSSNRKSVEVNVYLADGNSGVSRCMATDISANGIFLKTNPLYVPRHKCLKLMFALRINSSNVVRLRRIAAIVTRSQQDGVGMRFCASRKYGKARAVGS
jgi:hypothetical protein